MTHEPVFISPAMLWRQRYNGWSPTCFVGPAARAMRATEGGVSIADMGGRVFEGLRATPDQPSDLPIFKPTHIAELALLPAEHHWCRPQIEGPWSVQTGDVVINKIAPIRAGLVAPLTPRHPVDGNCLIVRGLGPAEALWLAICLNRPEYAALLLAGQTGIQRLSQAALKSLRVPIMPIEADNLARQALDLQDSALLAREAITRLRGEAERVADHSAEVPSLRNGHRVSAATVGVESWLPASAALRAYQTALVADAGWVPLRAFTSTEARSRLADLPPGAHVLRLSAVQDDLFVDGHEQEDGWESAHANRTLARRLLPGDVIISTLGSSFRAAYVDQGVRPRTYPSDGWVCLRCHETPAAWALLLSTSAIKAQVARMAIGVAQQFVPPAALADILLPPVAYEQRERWQRQLDQHHNQCRQLEAGWAQVFVDAQRLFDEAHPQTKPRRAANRESQS